MTDKAGWHHSWPRNEVRVHRSRSARRLIASCSAKYTDADMHNMFAYLETLQ